MTDSEKLNLILEKVGILDESVNSLKSDMQDVKQKVGTLESDMKDVKQKVGTLESDMQEVKEKVRKIDVTLENEIRVNIQRVAEGHLDISRNLHEAMKPNNEIEMLAIKVRMLESDVRELKYKIS